jgi:hypothetical protein
MPIYFERPVGACADVSELEYISALHQTCDNQLRQDCSITAKDIQVFLRSRYGVLVDEEEVKGTIIAGLGGGNHDNEIIDLMEIVAIQLIPTILKAALLAVSPLKETLSDTRVVTMDTASLLPDSLVRPEPDLLKRVLTMILEDVTGDATPKKLDKELLTKIFRAYGEMHLAEDEVLQEQMIAAACPSSQADGEGPFLDLATFARVLTHDIEEYDLKNEMRCTTNFDDVLLTQAAKDFGSARRFDASRELTLDDVKDKKEKSSPILTEWTAQAIDSTAGNYRNKLLIVMLSSTGKSSPSGMTKEDFEGLLAMNRANRLEMHVSSLNEKVMITYFAYWFSLTMFKIEGVCPEYVYDYSSPWQANTGTVACETGTSVLSWLLTFLIFRYGCFTSIDRGCDEPVKVYNLKCHTSTPSDACVPVCLASYS